MPKKSRGKAGKEGDEGGGSKTKSKKMSKFDMLKAECGDDETEDSGVQQLEEKKTKKPKKVMGDPGYRPKEKDDEDLQVCWSTVNSTSTGKIDLYLDSKIL